MYLKKRGDVYHVRVRVAGREAWRTTGCSVKKDAMLAAKRIKAKLQLQVAEPEVEAEETVYMLSDGIDDALRLHYRKYASTDRPRYGLGKVLRLMGDLPLAEIESEWFDELRLKFEDQGYTGATYNRHAALVSKVLRFACERRLLKGMPYVPREVEKLGRDRVISIEEEQAILGLAEPPLRDLIVTLLDTGMRRGEAFKLTPEDIDLESKMIRLYGTKNGDNRSVPMTDRVEAVMKERLQGKKVFPEFTAPLDMTYAFKRVVADAGLEGVVMHSCRHTCATRLAKANLNLPIIQAWLGHRDSKSTQRYTHLRGAELRGAAEVLNAAPSFAPPAAL